MGVARQLQWLSSLASEKKRGARSRGSIAGRARTEMSWPTTTAVCNVNNRASAQANPNPALPTPSLLGDSRSAGAVGRTAPQPALVAFFAKQNPGGRKVNLDLPRRHTSRVAKFS